MSASFKISWGNTRDLEKHNFEVKEYYREVADYWNIIGEYLDNSLDKSSEEYNNFLEFINRFLRLYDVIYQNEEEHKNKIRELEEKLSRWTEQQKGRKTKVSDDKRKQILKWKEEGISNCEIAKKIGVTEGTVRYFIKKSNN